MYKAGVWWLSHCLCPRECKGQQHGKWEQQQLTTSLDKLRVQQKRTVMGEINGNILHLPVSTLQGPSTSQGPPEWVSPCR